MMASAAAVAAFFLAPLLEGGLSQALPGQFGGLPVFPILATIFLLRRWSAGAVTTTLLGAVWRDLILLRPFASTLSGTVLLVFVVGGVRAALTTYPLATRAAAAGLGYGAYVAGEAFAAAVRFRVSGAAGWDRPTLPQAVASVAAVTAVAVWLSSERRQPRVASGR